MYVLRVYLLCAIIAGIDLIPGSSDENAVTTPWCMGVWAVWSVKCHYNDIMRTAPRLGGTFVFHEAPWPTMWSWELLVSVAVLLLWDRSDESCCIMKETVDNWRILWSTFRKMNFPPFKMILVLTNFSLLSFLIMLMVDHYNSHYNVESWSSAYHILSLLWLSIRGAFWFCTVISISPWSPWKFYALYWMANPVEFASFMLLPLFFSQVLYPR